MFITTIADDEATGEVAKYYKAEKDRLGYLMNATRSWTARADLLPIYEECSSRIRAGFSLSPRDWRLITLIAAKAVPSTYCSVVYGQHLVADLGSADAVLDVQADFRNAAVLGSRDVEMLAYAERVATDASSINQSDIDRLRDVGFSDPQIADIALCAAFRCFISRFSRCGWRGSGSGLPRGGRDVS